MPYVVAMGFTHVEFLPVTEHPFDGSWGYQPIGLFAPTHRFGDPDDFRLLVDRFHAAGIAVIIDWVPGALPEGRTRPAPASMAPRSTSTRTRARARMRTGAP